MRRGPFLLLFCALLGLLALSFAPVPAEAQNVYAGIRGVITDQSGAVLPDVNVTATNIATGVARTTVTTKDGTYEFLQLQIGDYNLRAEKTGFEVFTATKIHLDVNQIYVQDMKLHIGTVTQEVTVQANPVQVESTNMQLGEVIGAQAIADAPLVTRNFVELQQLQPGVVGASDRFNDNYATNGSESQQNAYLINGMDSADIALNTPQVIPSPDALSEFRLMTSTINPEYGRNSGAILNALVKSGTDQFHGDVFEFFRDTSLNGRNYFQATPSIYHQNLFGGTVGGPIWKNHTFFFFSYQGSRFTEPQGLTLPTVGTTAEQGGDFSAVNTFNGVPPTPPPGGGPLTAAPTNPNVSPIPLFGDVASPCPVLGGTPCPAGTYYGKAYDNNGALITNGLFSTGVVPTQDFNSVSTNLAKLYLPAPNWMSKEGLDQYTFNPTEAGKTDQYLFRIDHTFNQHDQIWEYSLFESDPRSDTLPFLGADLPGFGEYQQVHSKEFIGAWQHIFTSNVLNELHLGYQRLNFNAVEPQNVVQPSSLGFTGINPQNTKSAGAPVVYVSGGGVNFEMGFSVYGPQPRIDETYQAGDNFSYIHGTHTLKFGYEGRRFEVHNPFFSENNGDFTFGGTGPFSTGNAMADFLLGIPDSYGQSSGNVITARAYEHYAYAQDQWRVKSNFTLTYGLGWDINTPLNNLTNGGLAINCFTPYQQSTVYPSAPLGLLFPGDAGCTKSGYRTHYNDFAPRLGFAWTPDLGWLSGGPGKLSIRGGVGIYYNRGEEELTLQFLTDPPFALSDYGVADVGGLPSFAAPFTSVNPANVDYTKYNGNGATSPTNPTQPETIAAASIANKYPFVVPRPGTPVNFGFYEPMGLATIDPNFKAPYAENYNLTIERQLPGETILTVAYVGSMGHNLETWYERNPGLPGECLADPACVGAGPSNAWEFPQYHRYDSTVFGSIGTMASIGNSNYNSLQISADKRLSHGLSFLASYTYAHALDNSSSFEDHAFNGLGMDPFDFHRYYGSSAYDARHRLVLNYTYEIPKVPGTADHTFLDRAINGWRISGITTFQSGLPVTIFDQVYGLFGVSSYTCPGAPMGVVGVSCWDTPNVTGSVSRLDPRTNGDLGFTTSAFSKPVYGTAPFNLETGGDAGRNFFRGFGRNQWDFQLTKQIPVTERYRFELRAELYNMFNHTQFANPDGNFTDPTFGLTSGIQGLPREVQLAAKFYF